MNNHILSRKNLETLSSADLMSLADEYGIDVPEDLNRRFIIAELADIAVELESDELSGLTITDSVRTVAELPLTYNETVISAVLSNPVWLYVYWDISSADRAIINMSRTHAVFIVRVAVIGDDGKIDHKESFDIPVSVTDTDQYILLPSGDKNIRVELILETPTDKPRLLAVSGNVPLTGSCPDFHSSLVSGHSPMLELSGFKELVRSHFLQHRQAIS
jgi:hypothetical protein